MTAETFSCVVIGEETILIECTRLLAARGHTVAAVVTPSAELLAWAQDEGLPAVPLGPDLVDRLASLSFDYLFSLVNSRILSEDVLALPARLSVNFHDAPLPRHAGVLATSWAILGGDEQHGITWHVMDREVDTGDVLKQRAVSVESTATAHDLNVACFDAAIESFAELIDELAAGTATRVPQDLDLRTYHGRYDGLPRAGVFDWRKDAAELDKLVRATAFGRRRNDLGTALLVCGDDLLAVRAVEVTDRPSAAEPGTVVDAGPEALTVATGGRDVRLTGLATLSGEPLDLVVLAETLTREHGGRFARLPDAEAAELTEAACAAHRQENRWLRALRSLQPVPPPSFGRLRTITEPARPVPLPDALRAGGTAPEQLSVAAALAFLARLTRGDGRHVAVCASAPSPAAALLLSPEVPLHSPERLFERTLLDVAEWAAVELDRIRSVPPYRRDVLLRHPDLGGAARTGLPIAVILPGSTAGPTDRPLTVRIDATGAVRFHAGAELTENHERWLTQHFVSFLDSLAADPKRPLGAVELLDFEEREVLLGRWNDTGEEYPRHKTVTRLVTEVAGTTPDAIAVRFGDRSLTYGELDQAAERLARHLADLGAGPGSVVGVHLERSTELLVGLLAVLRTGAAYLPIDPFYPPARIRHVLQDSGTRLVVTDGTLSGTLTDSPVTPVIAGTAPLTGREAQPAAPFDRSTPETPAYLIYTSGSTGLPKGVQVGHRALVNFLWTMARRPGFCSQDSLLALTTVGFDIAALELYLPLVRGGTVEILSSTEAADGVALRERIERSAPSVLQATPSTWLMLLDAGWQGAPALRALCGGEPLQSELAERLAPRVGALYNMYGPTETTVWSTVDRVRPGEPITIGRPIGNTRCHVLDERGVPVPPGIPGELYLSGDGVADGYLGCPELTAERFVPAPEGGTGRAYRTGDLVRHLPNGRLEYLERIDGQIKLNGYRIEPGEVESALRQLPGVTAAVAAVTEDRPGECRLVGYLVGPTRTADTDGLRAALVDCLPDYMVPSAVVVLRRLPLTPNGKVDRKALAARRRAPSTESVSEIGLRSDLP